jgi:hypothetical protein
MYKIGANVRGSLTKLAVVAQTGNIFAEVFTETVFFSKIIIFLRFSRKYKNFGEFSRDLTWFLG